MEYQAYYALMM